MLFGAWPSALGPDDDDGLALFRDRIIAWQEKSLRETKLRSSWAGPDADYEKRASAFVERLLDPAWSHYFIGSLAAFERQLRPAADANALVQTLLRNTVPGVADLYQGAEYRDLTLVDPDNRHGVDVDNLRRSLDARVAGFDAAKQALWLHGSYEPVAAKGPRSGNVVAFTRRYDGKSLLAAGLLHCAPILIQANAAVPPTDWWNGTCLLPPDSPSIELAMIFTATPAHVSLTV